MGEVQNIQWFPGHMTKAMRSIRQSLKMVDAVAEIIDARVPVSSRNPDLNKLTENKPTVIILNKCDMADKAETDRWISYFGSRGIKAIAADSKSGKGVNRFVPAVKSVLKPREDKLKAKGMTNPTMRIMIAGIPNVGKSSFINRIAGQSRAKAEDRPGVTRGNQWYTIAKNIEMLDTPGVLWPKFDDARVGEYLAFTGAVKDDVTDTEALAVRLIDFLTERSVPGFAQRYKLEPSDISSADSYKLLEIIGKKRGMLISGGETDTNRAAAMLLDEFRSGKLGRITLETANEK